MIRLLVALILLTAGAGSLHAQTPLTLPDAIARAAASNPDARIAVVAEEEAAQRLVQARAGYLPRADLSETWQRGNQPVYVFGSLLAQRRFTAADFALEALNRPDALDNFRAAAAVEQHVWDGGQTRARVAAARAGVDLAASGRRRVGQALAVAAPAAYGQVLVAHASLRAAEAAMASADADRTRVTDRRDAGLVTDADVLAVDVHRAAVQENVIRARAAVEIGRAELNRVMGVPLDTVYELAPLDPLPSSMAGDIALLEEEALANRPEVVEAALRTRVSDADVALARAAFRLQVVAQAGWESNGGTWDSRAGSWLVSTGVRLNVFRGLADKARLAEATLATERRALEREQVATGIRVEVRHAVASLEAARARVRLAEHVVEQASEGQRIVRDRYEQGLADGTALTRAAEHVVQAMQQQVRARVDVQIASATLERVLGR